MTNVIVFVSNRKFFGKFVKSCHELVTLGKYAGPICLIIGDDLLADPLLGHDVITKNKVIIKHFPNLVFPASFHQANTKLARDKVWTEKIFQYHKFYVFDAYFKVWNYVLYIDTGIHTINDVQAMLNLAKPNTFLAHSDTHPLYNRSLAEQFDLKTFPAYADKLRTRFDLSGDYCQTCVMLFDTNLLTKTTVKELCDLTVEYPLSNTNDQAIIALYMDQVRHCWQPLPIKDDITYFYDFFRRNDKDRYIMFKNYMNGQREEY